MKRLRRWVVLAIVAVLAALGVSLGTTLARPAYADTPTLCGAVPAPVRPDFQVSGLVMDKPDLSTIPDVAPDPFTDTSVPLSDVYGWAWRYTNYDLGCGNDYVRDQSAVATTMSANFVLAWMNTLNSQLASLEDISRSGTFSWLQPVVTTVAGLLTTRVLTVWLPLAALVLAVIIGYQSRKASYAETLRRVAVFIGALLLAVLTLVFPRVAIQFGDDAINSFQGAASAGFSGDVSDLVARESLYQTWLVGNFGSADSPVAVEYGPKLMAATTYTWSDVKKMDADPTGTTVRTQIDNEKAAAFKQLATEVQQKDPAAYASLTGKTDTRTAPSTLGLVWLVTMGLFVGIAAFVVVLARLVMLGLIIYGMLASVVGVVKFGVLQKVWDLFTAAVLNVVKFVIAGGLMTMALTALSTAPVGVGWRLIITAVLTVLAIMLTKPVRSFKAMAGMDTGASVVGTAVRRAMGSAVAVATGGRTVGSAESREAAVPARDRDATFLPQPVEPSYPPLPPPTSLAGVAAPAAEGERTAAWGGFSALSQNPDWAPLHASPEVGAAPSTVGGTTAAHAASALPALGATAKTLTGAATTGQSAAGAAVAAGAGAAVGSALAGVGRASSGSSSDPKADPAAVDVDEDTLVPGATTVAAVPATTGKRPRLRAAGGQLTGRGVRPGESAASDPVRTSVPSWSGALAGAESLTMQADQHAERAAQAEAAAAGPSPAAVVDHEFGLYRSASTLERFPHFSEAQVDDDGHQVWEPVYRADRSDAPASV